MPGENGGFTLLEYDAVSWCPVKCKDLKQFVADQDVYNILNKSRNMYS